MQKLTILFIFIFAAINLEASLSCKEAPRSSSVSCFDKAYEDAGKSGVDLDKVFSDRASNYNDCITSDTEKFSFSDGAFRFEASYLHGESCDLVSESYKDVSVMGPLPDKWFCDCDQ